jgi:hypothetical protein
MGLQDRIVTALVRLIEGTASIVYDSTPKRISIDLIYAAD